VVPPPCPEPPTSLLLTVSEGLHAGNNVRTSVRLSVRDPHGDRQCTHYHSSTSFYFHPPPYQQKNSHIDFLTTCKAIVHPSPRELRVIKFRALGIPLNSTGFPLSPSLCRTTLGVLTVSLSLSACLTACLSVCLSVSVSFVQ